MGAFSDKNNVFYSNGYKVVYNNERLMFKNNSARNLFSQTYFFPRGTDDVQNKTLEENYKIVPDYITDSSYLFFNTYNTDMKLYPFFSENVKNISHAFAFQSMGLFNTFNPSNGCEGPSFPNSIEDASGLFKASYTAYSIVAANFIRNMPNNIVSLNNTFFHAGYFNTAYAPLMDENNEYMLDNYMNLFDLWHQRGYLSAQSSNFTYPLNYYYNVNNEDKKFMNSAIPDSVKYMNGTFALTSIGIDWYYGVSNNDVEFHLPNNLKDASFCFFNTSYTNNFRFTLPDSLTEANYMFASSYGYNFPNQVRFGNGLKNAVGMFAQLAYGYGNINNTEDFERRFPGGLPNTIINASKMFSGCNVAVMINIPRSVEDASFFLCCGGFAGYWQGEWNNNDYIIPNTVKNIDFAFSNLNIAPNNNVIYNFLQNYEYRPENSSYLYSCSRYNNTHFIFEEGSEIESVRGMLLGCNLNRPLEIPNSVKDISYLLCAGGTNYADLGGEAFFNNILKENVENAAWAFCYGYVNDITVGETNIYMPQNLKNIVGMFSNLYMAGSPVEGSGINFIGLENTQVENAAYFLNGSSYYNKPIYFPSTIKSFYRTFASDSYFRGQYNDWTFNLEQFPNLENCDYMFYYCTNFNIPVNFPNSLKSLEGVFSSCNNFNQPVSIPEGVISTKDLFSNCANFDQYVPLPASLEIADNMFNNCPNFNYGGYDLDFSGATNLISMEYMFNNCSNMNKIINEQSLRWPPHVERISGLFNNCLNVDIETFVIPSSIKTGTNILTGTTISNGIYIQKGYEYLFQPFGNLKGKTIGSDGNYYINSIIIECGNGNICLSSYASVTFNNTNVNSVIFKDGNLNLRQNITNYYGTYIQPGNFIIYGSNKFNGNIEFIDVDYIDVGTGNFGINNCPNFDKPINFPAIVNSAMITDNYRHTIVGDYNDGNYFVIYHDLTPKNFNDGGYNNRYIYSFEYNFAENNSTFKEALNRTINNPTDYLNLFNHLNDYPTERIRSNYYSSYIRPAIVDNCLNFNSPISFEYGTNFLKSVIRNCSNYNQPITIPSTVSIASEIIEGCSNFDQPLLIPGTVKDATRFVTNCPKFNTTPLFGSGIEVLNDFFVGLANYNSKTYLPDTLLKAANLFRGCSNYNQETDFFSCYALTGALEGCSKYNSNTNFFYSDNKVVTNLFLGDYLFDKEIDFNCRTLISGAGAFSGTKINTVKNCNFTIDYINVFHHSDSDAKNPISTFMNALTLRGSNVFYYSSPWQAERDINFYNYNSTLVAKSCAEMFRGCSSYNSPIVPDLRGVTYASGTFWGCSNFNQPVNLYCATQIANCFNGAYNFNQPLIFNNVIQSCQDAFYYCDNLVYVPKFLKGIRISGRSEWNATSSKAVGSGINTFQYCHKLGVGQEGFDYAIIFHELNRDNNRTTVKPGCEFFSGCYNLNIPIIFNTNDCWMPQMFLEGCNNYNSNVIFELNNSKRYFYAPMDIINNFSSNLPFEVINYDNTTGIIRFNYSVDYALSGAASFWGCNNYNRFPEFRYQENNTDIPEIYFEMFMGEYTPYRSLYDASFFYGCDIFNYPVQRYFIPINKDYMEYYEGYTRKIHPRTGWQKFITYCPNFNQPILSYYFDSPESLSVKCDWYSSLDLNFVGCKNFNQSLIGNFTRFNHSYNYFNSVSMNLYDCITPDDIRINIIFNSEIPLTRNASASDHFCFAGLKTPTSSPHRNLYLRSIVEGDLNIDYTFGLTGLIGGQSGAPITINNFGYENFVPENIYIDVENSISRHGVTLSGLPVFSYCNYYNNFYRQNYQNSQIIETNNLQDNQTIKNLQFLPSWNSFNYQGDYNSSSKTIVSGCLMSYVDCGYIDLWNTILNRNCNFNYTEHLFFMLKNVYQDFHFEEDSAVNFYNANNLFVFGDNCEVNIYINSFKSLNNVNAFATIGNSTNLRGWSYTPCETNVNVYIKGGLTLSNTYNFFNIYEPAHDYYIGEELKANMSPTYYIGEGTVFYKCGYLPKKIGTYLNLAQFQGLTLNVLSGGRYKINSNIDLSTYSTFITNGLYNVLFEGNGNIIFNPSRITKYNVNTGALQQIGGCRNFVINQTYSGTTTLNNLFRNMYTESWNTLVNNKLIDETNTRVNLYVKGTTSLGSYLRANSQRAFNIISNLEQYVWDNGYIEVQELEDRFFYTRHFSSPYQTEPSFDLYYNIIFY